MTTNSSGPLDRFVHGRAATLCAFAWGFAEATLFFFVPDVLLTLIACRSLRASLKATTASILGESIETRGKQVTPGNVAYYAVKQIRQGRRSTGFFKSDAFVVVAYSFRMIEKSEAVLFQPMAEIGIFPAVSLEILIKAAVLSQEVRL